VFQLEVFISKLLAKDRLAARAVVRSEIATLFTGEFVEFRTNDGKDMVLYALASL